MLWRGGRRHGLTMLRTHGGMESDLYGNVQCMSLIGIDIEYAFLYIAYQANLCLLYVLGM